MIAQGFPTPVGQDILLQLQPVCGIDVVGADAHGGLAGQVQD